MAEVVLYGNIKAGFLHDKITYQPQVVMGKSAQITIASFGILVGSF